jgi:hypothetical protein
MRTWSRVSSSVALRLETTTNIPSIVFVHGLGSNPDTTWRAEKPTTTPDQVVDSVPDGDRYVSWITDFLPDDLPPTIRKDARIFFYNYDSYWKRDAVHTRLWNLGNGLLEHIKTGIRRSEEVKIECNSFDLVGLLMH